MQYPTTGGWKHSYWCLWLWWVSSVNMMLKLICLMGIIKLNAKRHLIQHCPFEKSAWHTSHQWSRLLKIVPPMSSNQPVNVQKFARGIAGVRNSAYSMLQELNMSRSFSLIASDLCFNKANFKRSASRSSKQSKRREPPISFSGDTACLAKT